MEQKKIPTEWNLSDLGTSYNDPSFLKERKLHERAIKKFARRWKKNQSYLTNPDTLLRALNEYEQLNTLPDREGMYLFLMRQVDSLNTELAAAEKKYIDWVQKLSDEIRFFSLSLGKIERSLQKKILADERFADYKNYLKGIFETAKYQLSEPEERILSLKSGVASGNWASMVGELFARESAEVLVKKGSRRVKEVKPFAEILANLQSSCSRVRASAAKALVDIFRKHSFVVEKEFNSILEDKKINDMLRGFKRPDQARILSDDITPAVVDTLIETVTDYFSISRDFYKLKAQLMGKEKLHYYERNAPTFKMKKEQTFPYEKAVALVGETFAQLDEDFARIFYNMVETGKVDVYPRVGKQDGAFCMYHGKNEPVYVMLNYTKKMNDVMTLAHEMGHAVHGTLSKKENALNYDTPMFTAETASTFAEGLVFKRLLQEVNEKEQLKLMMTRLGDTVSTVMRQIAAYNFEWEVHHAFREKGYLSAEEIGVIFQKHMKSYMGPAVLQDYDAEKWWMYWSHFRSPFYVYSYASGLLMSNGMHAIINENPKKWRKVKAFFETGTSKSPKQIFKEMGINIEKRDFWEAGLKEIQTLLCDTKKLAKKLGKV